LHINIQIKVTLNLLIFYELFFKEFKL
jgi:hypothetical protein